MIDDSIDVTVTCRLNIKISKPELAKELLQENDQLIIDRVNKIVFVPLKDVAFYYRTFRGNYMIVDIGRKEMEIWIMNNVVRRIVRS